MAVRRVQYKELKLNPFKIFINQIDGYFLWLENMVLNGTVKNLTIKDFFIIMVFSFYLQNALMTFEEDKMAKSLTTLRAMEKRCSSNLSWSPSFSSFQSMKSRLWGAQAGLSHQQTQNVSNFSLQILRLNVSKKKQVHWSVIKKHLSLKLVKVGQLRVCTPFFIK